MPGRIRDPRFYYSDGNVVILVENTLFKVHRSILSQDSSVFESMFTVGGENPSGEGLSDENPVPLRGDTAEDFRALMWSLYALPHEILAEMCATEIKLLCQCARIAHKYQFQSIESWALKVLPQSFESAPLSSLVMLAEVAVLCDHTGLLNSIRHALRISLRSGDNNCSLIINVAERLNLLDIRGLAYYAMMWRDRKVWEADPFLTRDQRIRLFSGYYKVTKLSPAPHPEAPSLPHSQRCQSVDCKEGWGDLWRAIIDGHIQIDRLKALRRRTDLLGKVWHAEQVVEVLSKKWQSGSKHPLATEMCKASVNAMPGAVEKLLEKVSEKFGNFFADVS